MSERGAFGQLGRWVTAGVMTSEEAEEVDATIELLLDYVRLGAIDQELADSIIRSMAEEKAAAWAERQFPLKSASVA